MFILFFPAPIPLLPLPSDTTICDIIQVSAVCGDRVFNVYTLPRQTLTESAREVTGFTVRNAVLFLRGRPVDTIPLTEALTSFIEFLRSFGQPVLLAAHNARRFDMPVILRVLRRCSLKQKFQEVVHGFVDTFILSKQLFPKLSSYSQENMVRHFLRRTYDAHNAMEDARMLQELYKAWHPTRWQVTGVTFEGY